MIPIQRFSLDQHNPKSRFEGFTGFPSLSPTKMTTVLFGQGPVNSFMGLGHSFVANMGLSKLF